MEVAQQMISSWYSRNKERANARTKAWRAANPEKARASYRAWRAANPEKARASYRAWRAANPEKARASYRAWRAANPEKARASTADSQRKIKFGITRQQFSAMLDSQSGSCAICTRDKPGGRGNWHVDHDHDTGRIRGLLCHWCNLGLGQFRDKIELLSLAIDYLRRTAT
ncbi:MAG: endonuclease VII domain-containing protein [Egibacteraceae bacterium]